MAARPQLSDDVAAHVREPRPGGVGAVEDVPPHGLVLGDGEVREQLVREQPRVRLAPRLHVDDGERRRVLEARAAHVRRGVGEVRHGSIVAGGVAAEGAVSGSGRGPLTVCA